MATKVFGIQLFADTKQAQKELAFAAKRVAFFEDQIEKAGGSSAQFANAVYGLGGALVATVGTTVMAGSVIERAMIDVDIALRNSSTSAAELTDRFIEMNGSVTSLLASSKKFIAAGITNAKTLEEMGRASRLLGQLTGEGTERAAQGYANLHKATNMAGDELKDWLVMGHMLQEQVGIQNELFRDLSEQHLLTARRVKFGERGMLGLAGMLTRANASAQEVSRAVGEMNQILLLTDGRADHMSATMRLTGKGLRDFESAVPTKKLEMFMDHIGRMSGKGKGGLITAANQLQRVLKVGEDTAYRLATLSKDSNRFRAALADVGKTMDDTEGRFQALLKVEYSLSNQMGLLWDDFKDIAMSIGRVLAPVVAMLVLGLRGLLWVIKQVPSPILAIVVAMGGMVGMNILLIKLLSGKLVGSIISVIGQFFKLLAVKYLDLSVDQKRAAVKGNLLLLQLRQIRAYRLQIAAQLKSILTWAKDIAVRQGWILTAGQQAATQAALTASSGANTAATAANTTAQTFNNKVIWKNVVVSMVAAAKWLVLAAAKGVATVATSIYSVTLGIAKGIMIVTTGVVGFLSAAFSVLAGAIWTALAPILPFILIIGAVIGIMVGAYFAITKGSKAVKAFGVALLVALGPIGWVMLAIMGLITHTEEVGAAFEWIWDKIKAVASMIKNAIVAAFVTPIMWVISLLSWLGDVIGGVFGWFVDSLKWINGLFGTMGRVVGKVARFFQPLIDAFGWLVDKASALVGWLFGSSMFHIKEGVHEVSPSLTKLDDAFTGVGRAVGKVADGTQLPDDVRVRIEEPIRAGGGVAAPAPAPALAPAASAPMPTGGATATPVRVVVPVSVELDGMTIAQATSEYVTEIRNERHFNEPMHPLRGVEK
jgi:hypothetical protein